MGLTNEENREFEKLLISHRRFDGWLAIVIGSFFFIFMAFMFLYSFDVDDLERPDQLFGMVLTFVLLAGLGAMVVLGGIRTLWKNPNKRTKEEKVVLIKNTVKFLAVFALIILIIKIVYTFNLRHDTVVVYQQNQFEANNIYSKSGVFKSESHEIFIKTLNMELECSKEDIAKICDLLKDQKHKNTLKLEYEWNRFFPDRGKLIKISKTADR